MERAILLFLLRQQFYESTPYICHFCVPMSIAEVYSSRHRVCFRLFSLLLPQLIVCSITAERFYDLTIPFRIALLSGGLLVIQRAGFCSDDISHCIFLIRSSEVTTEMIQYHSISNVRMLSFNWTLFESLQKDYSDG